MFHSAFFSENRQDFQEIQYINHDNNIYV